jgi:hypothetical protein
MGVSELKKFDREFFDSSTRMTYIGSGELGGKAAGLVSISRFLDSDYDSVVAPRIDVGIPTMCVLTTEIFDKFMRLNDLEETAMSDARDDRIAAAFQKGSLPAEIVGDLRALATQIHRPLAIRSSSLLEDAINEPFAGVYCTKMIPNNQHDPDTRFRKLTEAIKFVFASTFFRTAKSYAKAAQKSVTEEKMAVIVQEVVGHRFGDRFYPHVSGVARSYNFYPSGHSKPEDGVINLALGLGKTVVDGGKCWISSPKYPKTNPPFNSIRDLMDQTQTSFWAVNMGSPPAYDPIKEEEFLVACDLSKAETDRSLTYIASTYDGANDRLVSGVYAAGPRVLTIAPSLLTWDIPLNDVLKSLLNISEKALDNEAELEFAMTLHPEYGLPAKFGFLQVRPMFVSLAKIDLAVSDLSGENVLAASDNVLGNGLVEDLRDVVYLKPDSFDASRTTQIAQELKAINQKLVDENSRFLLVTIGRLGTSDPWLGVPVGWGDVSAAKCVVECTIPGMAVDLSQGSHFFHNVIGLGVLYFSVRHSGKYKVDFGWLDEQQVIDETDYVKHVRLDSMLTVRVDGRNGRGIIVR